MSNVALVLCLSLVLAAGPVTRAADPQVPADAAAAMAAAMAALTDAAEKNAAASTAVDPKAMKALLPEKDGVPGFTRTKLASESQAAMGFRINTARAEFRQMDGEGTLSIELRDVGGLHALAKAAMQLQEVDEETETGFRRTAVYAGFKAEEQYDSADKSGEIKLIAGDRVGVEVSGRGVSFATLKAVLEKLDLKKLAALKPVAAPAAPAQP